MKKLKRLFLTALFSATALFITCSMAFASNAIVDEGGYTHPSQFSDTIVLDGIDVSEWQADVNWEKVKKHGIDYAYIRLGFSYLDSPFRRNLDSYFEQNYQEAKEAGIMVGVYYYSTAISISEAQKEAQFCLDVLNGRELDLPVVFDFELDGRQGSAYNSWSSGTRKSKATSNCLAFMNYIEKNSDYKSMFYTFRNVASPYLNPGGGKLNMNMIDSKYRVWLAQYSSDNSYERPYDTWQYTSGGSVSGISGRTDCNFWYYDNDAEITQSGTKSIKNADVTLGQKSYQYNTAKREPSVSVSYNGKTLTESTDYKVHYLKNVLAGTAYARIEGLGSYSNVKLVPFTISRTNISNGGKVADIKDVTYSGKLKIPSPKVTYNGTVLKKGTDYTLSWSNNRSAGTATVKVTGKRNFTGTISKNFKILKLKPTFTGYVNYYRTTDREDFTLNAKCNSDADLTYKSDNTDIATVDQNGKVSLQGGTGTVTITVTSPETKNCEKAIREVKIHVTKKDTPAEPDNPNQDLIDSVESTEIKVSSTLGEKFIRLDWERTESANLDYFEVYRSETSGVYDDKPIFTTKSGTSNYYKNTKNLTDGVKYYYRLRGVCEIDGEKYYTPWSNQAIRTYRAPEENPDKKLIEGVQNTTMTARSELGSGYIRVKWTKSYGYKMDHFEIYRSTKKGEYSEKPLYKTPNGNWKSYKNTKNLKKGTRYYYRVRGVREINGTDYYTQWSKQAIRTYK